jgi:hypothetical protein
MKYFLFLVLTIVLSWSIINISNKKLRRSFSRVGYRQSTIYEIIKDIIPKEMFAKTEKMTQSRYHAQKNMIKVVMSEGKAYWIINNVFYIADTVNGRIDSDTVQPLDVHKMSKKELEKLLSILDSLKDGDK